MLNSISFFLVFFSVFLQCQSPALVSSLFYSYQALFNYRELYILRSDCSNYLDDDNCYSSFSSVSSLISSINYILSVNIIISPCYSLLIQGASGLFSTLNGFIFIIFFNFKYPNALQKFFLE